MFEKNVVSPLQEGAVDKKALKVKIEALGGKVVKAVDSDTAAVVTTKDAVEKKSKSKVIKAAMDKKIQVNPSYRKLRQIFLHFFVNKQRESPTCTPIVLIQPS